MLLRNKLSLIALLFFLVAALGLSLALNHQNRLQQQQSAQAASAAQASLWQKVVETAQNELSLTAETLRPNINLSDQNLRQTLSILSQDLLEKTTIQRLEVYEPSGKQIYSSDQSYFPATSLGERSVRTMFDRKTAQSGLVIDSERQTLLIESFFQEGRYLFVLSRAIEPLRLEFEGLTRSQSLLVNRRGRLLMGADETWWETVAPDVTLDLLEPVQILAHEDRFYQVTLNRVDGALHEIGFTLSVRDISARHHEYVQLQWIIYGGMGGFLLLASLGLWAYLHRSLNPLSDAIDTLGRLAQGDYKQHMLVNTGKDEVARIGTAILKFHKNLIRLDRMKKARDNRGHRQSAIIRRELSALSETLDEEARKTVLNDLQEIEDQFANSPTDTASGSELAAMALTLKRLRERIQTQHHQLAQTILELEEALKSKTAYLALQQELAIGARVQLALLPDDLPQTDAFEIAGFMKPAKEVGGDFYDFFMLDDHRLGVVIADVSGKGIPAALFMAITRTVLRATAGLYDQTGSCIEALNDEVCANNKEELFVTLFYGIVDFSSLRFSYTNAGHNPVYHLKGTEVRDTPLTGDVALGVMDALDYSHHEIDLSEGDALFFYTDGITEAMNPAHEEFGTEIMKSDLAAHEDIDMKNLLNRVVGSVEKFAEGADQADDITCVGLRIKSKISQG